MNAPVEYVRVRIDANQSLRNITANVMYRSYTPAPDVRYRIMILFIFIKVVIIRTPSHSRRPE
jgi:hypothetical protein